MKTLDEHKGNISEFAEKFGLSFEEEGECGFGRACVGITNGLNWVNYNPHNEKTYEPIEEFYDEQLYDITPINAYHKHTCLAVLGRGEDAIKQLSDWVDTLKRLGAVIEKYETGASGIQAIFSGVYNHTVKIPKNNNVTF